MSSYSQKYVESFVLDPWIKRKRQNKDWKKKENETTASNAFYLKLCYEVERHRWEIVQSETLLLLLPFPFAEISERLDWRGWIGKSGHPKLIHDSSYKTYPWLVTQYLSITCHPRLIYVWSSKTYPWIVQDWSSKLSDTRLSYVKWLSDDWVMTEHPRLISPQVFLVKIGDYLMSPFKHLLWCWKVNKKRDYHEVVAISIFWERFRVAER